MNEDIVSTLHESASSEYYSLMSSYKSRGLVKSALEGYYEKHHIVPKSLGGSNDSSNLVLLTFPEHVQAHKLLHTIHRSRQTAWALKSLCMPISDRPELSEEDKLEFLTEARIASREYWNTDEGKDQRRKQATAQWSTIEAREAHSKLLTERFASPEARLLKSETAKKNIPMIEALIEVNKSRVKPVSATSLDGTTELYFESAKDAMDKGYASHAGSISQVCNGKRKSHNGYVWKFTGDN